MANPEQLEILRQSVKAWNQWRQKKPGIKPNLLKADLKGTDLSGANLRGANLKGANLSDARLSRADLIGANLSGADLSDAKLGEAHLTGANLSGADLAGADLKGADLIRADLIRADLDTACLLRGADLSGANLSDANLSSAYLQRANLTGANLNGAKFTWADLSGANLSGANLTDANLSDANLSRADLIGANLTGANLSDARLSEAYFGFTVLANTDITEVKGLESVIHHGPSTLGIDTFFRSKGSIPKAFLRGTGVPDTFINYAASLAGVPFESYSCFISYSTEDEEFATRLHNDFQANGIRCWKWNHVACAGRSLWGEIDKAIRVYDKLVLIASESSLKSPAVNREIERALVQEDDRLKRKLAGDANADCDVLYPVRLDDYIFKGWNHERKVDVTKKVIADARGWADDPAVYRRVLKKLLSDLKNEKPKPNPSSK